jgi:hypothetical protein
MVSAEAILWKNMKGYREKGGNTKEKGRKRNEQWNIEIIDLKYIGQEARRKAIKVSQEKLLQYRGKEKIFCC